MAERLEEVEQVKGILLVVTVMVITVTLVACHSPLVRTPIDASSIPDQTYDVTVYSKFLSGSYAVLFDIPGDGVEVLMRHTAFTETIGEDSPVKYIDRFNSRIRFYRTIQISDQDDIVRGYLMVSGVLDYWIAPAADRIVVGIDDRSRPR